MRVAGFIQNSVVNGVGIRDVVFVQGCHHQCKGCQNQHTWNYAGGQHMFVGDVFKKLCETDNNVTISGGEPLDQYAAVLSLCEMIKQHTNKTIWLYTGNTVKAPISSAYRKLAEYVDVIVDGRFEIDKKDLTLQFRGSSNQRIIDLPKSVEANEIVLWED